MKSKIADSVIERILRNVKRGIKESPEQKRSPIGRIMLSPEFMRQETLDFPLKRYMNLEEDILGTYTPMTSPGTITLHSHELNAYFFHLLNYLQSDLNLYIIEKDLKQLITLVVFKTYHHEFFHFFCEVQRQLFPTLSSDHLQEEALAVVYSALRIDEQREPGN